MSKNPNTKADDLGGDGKVRAERDQDRREPSEREILKIQAEAFEKCRAAHPEIVAWFAGPIPDERPNPDGRP